MLKGTALAKRAVKVLLNKLQGNTEEQIKFLEFLKQLEEVYRKNKTFRDLVLNEQIPLSEKEKVFDEFVQKLDLDNKELAKEFLVFLTKHHGFKYLSLIIRAYQYELETVLGTLKAEIITASELPEEIKQQLVQTLESKLNRKVEATFSVDPEIIGGFVVKTTSFVVDASVKDLLKELAMKI
jgi:F-type H+-transporting ATPase subunit delta